MAAPVLALREVAKTFHVKQGIFGEKLPLHALADISLELNEGEVVGLVGESGCGKTTLAKILLGLLSPDSGDVRIGEVALTAVPPRERARLVQPIFQDPYSSLNPRKTVAQIVGLPLAINGQASAADHRKAVTEMLEMVGLPAHTANNYPSQMSGGQRQRVAIARALIARPRVLICDEPTSALDVSVQSQILNLLEDLRAELKLSYLLISHNLAVVRHMADRLVVMYLGRIVEQGSTAEIFARPQHPYSEALLASALPIEPGAGLPAIDLKSEFPNPIHPPSGCAFHPRCPRKFDRCPQERPVLTPRASGGRAACHLESI